MQDSPLTFLDLLRRRQAFSPIRILRQVRRMTMDINQSHPLRPPAHHHTYMSPTAFMQVTISRFYGAILNAEKSDTSQVNFVPTLYCTGFTLCIDHDKDLDHNTTLGYCTDQLLIFFILLDMQLCGVAQVQMCRNDEGSLLSTRDNVLKWIAIAKVKAISCVSLAPSV